MKAVAGAASAPPTSWLGLEIVSYSQFLVFVRGALRCRPGWELPRMNGLGKIGNAPDIDLGPAVAENHLIEKRFGSVCSKSATNVRVPAFSGIIMLCTVASCSLPWRLEAHTLYQTEIWSWGSNGAKLA